MNETATGPFTVTPCRVDRVAWETGDTFTLTLDPPDGAFPFAPGQFNMLYRFGVGEVPLSISGDPARPDRLVHTIRAVGGVTRPLSTVEPGEYLGVRGPYGVGWPMAKAEGGDLLIVTGGVGLAPLRPVIYHLLANRERYGKVTLLYGARTAADLLFTDELARWGETIDVALTVDTAVGPWRGNVGVVTKLIPGARFDPADATAFVCGPEVMIRFTIRDLLEAGVAADRLFVSLERNMKCGVGLCGRCQCGPLFVCKDGPVFGWPTVARLFTLPEV
jgi:NAD(P)H-flavin reductase